jgi:GAF domain-containing protein
MGRPEQLGEIDFCWRLDCGCQLKSTDRACEAGSSWYTSFLMKSESEQLYLQTKQRAAELETLFAIQQAITRRLEPEVVLQLIADEARRLTASQRSVVFLLEGDMLRLAVGSGGEENGTMLDYRMPVEGSLIGEAIRTGQAIAVTDAEHDPHVRSDPRRLALVRQTGVQSMIVVPLLSGDHPLGAISISDKTAGTYGPDDERVLEMLASSAGIGLENARLYQAEQERRQVAEGLREVLAILNSDRSLAEVLAYIAAQAVRLLGGRSGAIFRWQPEQGQLTLQAAHQLPDEGWFQTPLPVGQSVIGRTILSRRPVAIPDVAAWEDDGIGSSPTSPLRWAQHCRAFLGVPLVIKDELYGSIGLFFAEPRDFSEEELDLAAAFGNQAALAIENAQLRQQVEQAAVLRERSRLARELHDSVTQSLYSLTLLTEGWRRIVEAGHTEQVGDYLTELGEIAHQGLKEMRLLIHELRPPVLEEEGLVAALQQRLDAVEGRAGVKTRLVVDGLDSLDPTLEDSLYRIAQEALNNTLKHAAAGARTICF